MDNIVFEDGLGNKYDTQGNEVMEFEMEADNEMYPVECITDYDSYTDLKPPEKLVQERTKAPAVPTQVAERPNSYKHYKDTEKEKFFFSLKKRE
ncbi:hypothetical protein EDC96DRAFT_328064 [Choanephora cucurbitarum]|nr:hypothetical protein EDC96DRAFT_328064 [Choanephora cucurbitarum]